MKDVCFIASSLDDLSKFPDDVKREVGFALYLAQGGDKGLNVVPLVGFGGAHVLEVVSSHDGNAYRAVYTVRFAEAVYVLHAFMKKSKSGRATPRPDVALVKHRLKSALEHYEQMQREREKRVEKRSAS